MRAADPHRSSFTEPVSLRRRGLGFLFAVLANLLVLLMLLRLAPEIAGSPGPTGSLKTFDVPAERASSAARQRSPEKTKRATRQTAARTPPPTPVTPPPVPTNAPWNVMMLSHDEYAASDISKLPSHADAAAGGGAGTGKGSGAQEGAGEGPGGARLYNAEWVREPTRAELATYLPPHASEGAWGIIACRTVERFHVEDCQELSDSPGSGMARAIRQAAWQFLVRPPRVDGRPQVGAWVKIRIDITQLKT